MCTNLAIERGPHIAPYILQSNPTEKLKVARNHGSIFLGVTKLLLITLPWIENRPTSTIYR